MNGDTSTVHIRAFLIADIRGYTAFTRERGDEAAAQLASTFARITREVVESRDGNLAELRGDEALAVFSSTRQSLRAAVELQVRYARHSSENPALALPVGIGVDAGEAVAVEGGYRGAALNMAARLCSAAGPGEVLTTGAVSHLAGPVDGLEYTDRRLHNVKGMSDPVRAVQVSSEALRGLLPALPATYRRRRAAPEHDLGAQINSLVQEHLAVAQEHLDEQLSVVGQMPQMQDFRPEPLRDIRPPVPVAPNRTRERKRQREELSATGRPLLVAFLGLIILAIIVIGILLWLHTH